MLFDGRRVSRLGAALAGGMIIDSFDAHDGHLLTKGHAGVAVLPAVLAYADCARVSLSAQDFLVALVIGYEVSLRAGVALHRTASDYHTSGAWTAVGVAALAARILGLDAGRSRHALGIAEYHGPRSQMMRCIDHPTMVKDGTGWGAMTGVSAAELAAEGFTGAPALLCEADDVADLWSDLGERWYLLEMFFKLYPVCRWAQPSIEAARGLQIEHGLRSQDIERIEVATFHNATRLAARRPATTEEAQYSLPFPLAAILARGRIGAEEVSPEALEEPEIARLTEAVELIEDDECNARFPAERLARATLFLHDGRVLRSALTMARGDPATALSEAELAAKYQELVTPLVGPQRSATMERDIASLDRDPDSLARLLELLLAPADYSAAVERRTG
jgi:2-methylcitrate dehydratase PrpD